MEPAVSLSGHVVANRTEQARRAWRRNVTCGGSLQPDAVGGAKEGPRRNRRRHESKQNGLICYCLLVPVTLDSSPVL